MTQLEVVRDPLWNNIRLDAATLTVLDAPAIQRLRYVRQLGHAFLVYPGATHTRFSHALGAYHLARRALYQLEDVAGPGTVDPAEALAVRLAALLHDVGHYPFSHALEEAGLPNHETLAERHLGTGELSEVLGVLGVPVPELLALIQGSSRSRLARLVSGSLDVDKLDYLSRDAMWCGVPYGVIDVDRLLASLTVVATPSGAGTVLALHEKGLPALESLVFAKYQMYRNVYWHHAGRSATAMFKRAVRRAIAAGQLTIEQIALETDDGLLHELMQRDVTGLAGALRGRRLAKRAVDVTADQVPADAADWAARDPGLLERVEDRLAREVGLQPNELFVDFPEKRDPFKLDLPVVRRDGRLLEPPELPSVAADLMRTARRLRVFVLRPAEIPARRMIALIARPAEDVIRLLDGERALLGPG
jgi:hypothetical protein